MEDSNKFGMDTEDSPVNSQPTEPMKDNPIEFGPIQGPPPFQGAPQQKHNKKGLGVGIFGVIVAVIVIVGGILFSKSLFGDDAKKQLVKGIANMAKERAAYHSSIVEDIGFVGWNKLKLSKPVHTNVDVSFTDPSVTGGFSNIDVEIDAVTDYTKKRAEYDLSIGTYGIDMNIGNIVASDNTLYMRAPLVFKDVVYSIDLTNLGRDFNRSAWSDLIDETMPEDYSLTLFDDAKTADNAQRDDNGSELFRIISKQSKVMADAMTYEIIGEKRTFSFGDTPAEYGGVQVIIDKDVYNKSMEEIRDEILASESYANFLNGYQRTYLDNFDTFKEEIDDVIKQIFGLQFKQDIVINFYLDKKGRIVNISTPEDLEVSDQYTDITFIAVDIDFSGKERALDTIEGGLYMQTEDEILFLEISRNAGITEDCYSEDLMLRLQDNHSDDVISFGYTNEWGHDDQTFDLQMLLDMPDGNLGFRADGAWTDIVKGEGYTLRVKHAAISADDEELLLMTGTIMTEPTDDQIEVPENAVNFFDMSSSEITGLFYGAFF